jgi:diguanylate cyclase (GGDEF)-like protein
MRIRAVSAWLGLPLDTVSTLPDAVVDAVAARMAGVEPHGAVLQDELVDYLMRGVTRGRQAEVDAMSDALTGVCNRRAWDMLVASTEAKCAHDSTPAAVIVVDLDKLKHVNDTQGHHAGDELLRRAAELLLDVSQDEDVIARIGGDEFGILSTGMTEPEAWQFAKRVEALLDADGIAASVGAGERTDSGGLKQAWDDADVAMYEAKWQRKSRDRAARGEALILGQVKRDGVPLAGAYVVLASPSGDFVGEVRSDSRGRFTLYAAAGEWRITALAPGGTKVEKELTLRPDSERHLELEL